jgi:hypothetical protein
LALTAKAQEGKADLAYAITRDAGSARTLERSQIVAVDAAR